MTESELKTFIRKCTFLEVIYILIELCKYAKSKKDYKFADAIKCACERSGIILEDNKDSEINWRIK